MLLNKLSIAIAAAFALLSDAAVVDLFSDTNCQVGAGSRNVFDNSCARLGGFQSFRITSGGGGGQKITAYSRNDCVAPATGCTDAGQVGVCIRATNQNGGSNAISSYTFCG
jgi:hypothetical protein